MRVLAWIFCLLLLAAGITFPIAMAVKGAEFSSTPRIILYGFFPICIAVLTLIAILRGDAMRKLIFAHGLAVMAALLGIEGYLQFWSSTSPNFANVEHGTPTSPPAGMRVYPVACGAHFDLARPRIQLEGKPAQPVAGLTNNLLNPEIADRTAWQFTDQYGFNNPPGQWTQSPVPVMVVGDSFAFGADVPIGSGFVDRLRQRIGQVVSLGCGGNGPLLELASLVEYGPVARPRVVVWTFYEGNDLIADLAAELRSPILPKYLSPDFTQGLADKRDQLDHSILTFLDRMISKIDTQSPVDSHGKHVSGTNMMEFVSALGMRNLTLINLRGALGLNHRIDPRLLDVFVRTLERAKSVVAEWNGRLVFVYLPARSRYVTALGQWDSAPYARSIVHAVESLDIPVINIDAVFLNTPDPAKLFLKHYTVEGYALVGDAIADAIHRLR